MDDDILIRDHALAHHIGQSSRPRLKCARCDTRGLRNRVKASIERSNREMTNPESLEPPPRPQCWHGSRCLWRLTGSSNSEKTRFLMTGTMHRFFPSAVGLLCTSSRECWTRLSRTGRIPCRRNTVHSFFCGNLTVARCDVAQRSLSGSIDNWPQLETASEEVQLWAWWSNLGLCCRRRALLMNSCALDAGCLREVRRSGSDTACWNRSDWVTTNVLVFFKGLTAEWTSYGIVKQTSIAVIQFAGRDPQLTTALAGMTPCESLGDRECRREALRDALTRAIFKWRSRRLRVRIQCGRCGSCQPASGAWALREDFQSIPVMHVDTWP